MINSKKQEGQEKWVDTKLVFWNMVLYFFSSFIMVLAVQHAALFYAFPPDPSLWVDVPTSRYFVLGVGVYIILKFIPIVVRKSIIFNNISEIFGQKSEKKVRGIK